MAKSKPQGYSVSLTKDKQTLGFVRIIQRKPGQYLIRYTDPESGRDIRQRLNNPSQKMLDATVTEHNRRIMGERGIVPGWRKTASDGQTVKDALTVAIRKTDGQPKVKANYMASANQFLVFMAEKFSAVSQWADVKPGMISEWLTDMRKRELAFDTIRLNLEPIRRTSVYWRNEDPDMYRDVYKAAGIKLKRPKRTPPVVLTVAQAQGFLDWLQTHSPALCGMATLQVMAGLRMYEAAYLRQGDIDFKNATVRIEETPWHKPKNNSSYRTVPVPRSALDAVQGIQAINTDSPLFVNRKGKPWKVDGLANAWRETMKAARADSDLDLPACFIAKNFRHTFATLAMQSGVGEVYLKRYMGHSANNILGNHYLAIDTADLGREVTDKFGNHWRKVWQQSGNTKTHNIENI